MNPAPPPTPRFAGAKEEASRTALAVSQLGLEALDDPSTPIILVERMLREIAISNRWFGGRSAVASGLRYLLQGIERGQHLSLLDIGTGAGDLPLWASRWCQRRGILLHPLGVERFRAAARLAQRNRLPVLLADGGVLPLRNKSVDLVMLSQVAHHFDDASIVRLIQESSRVARSGVLIADLRPSASAALAFRAAGALMGFHRTTIVDGVTSLARGFTPRRLERLLHQAGISSDAMISKMLVARVTAAWREA